MKDICAVSTPLAEGGISVIRISGENAISIGAKVFKPLSCKSVENMAGYSCAYGKIVDKNGREVDDGVLTVFRAPRSYTGENVCEISCHGGIYVTKKVLRLCIEQGAELAQRGEFTKRAFLNGKLSLTQAEGVMETISAQGEYALNSANLTKEGRLFRLISDMSRKFVTILGELAAWVDYPEEDLPEISEDNLRESLKNALAGLDKIIADHDSGMILKNGVDTVIAGKPNVGKSTLMNMLLGYDRSIVTNVAGTTRDVIEESAKLGELILKLSDTAGIHETDDEVEKIGVKKLGKKVIIVLNKSDLENVVERSQLEKYSDYVIEISAKLDEGREELQKATEKLLGIGGYDADSTIFANERQIACAERARKYLAMALESLDMGETLDAVTVMIDNGANALLELTGEKATEAVVDEVFSKFCVGK